LGDLSDFELNTYSNSLITKLLHHKKFGSTFRNADIRVVAGGGAYLLSEKVKQEYNITVPEEPEYSNVRGFFKLLEGEEK